MKLVEKKYALGLCLLLVLMSLFSCKKSFLEIIPPGRLIAKNTSDYAALLIAGRQMALMSGYDAPMTMGDDVSAIEPNFGGASLRIQRLFRWDANIYQPDEAPSDLSGLLSSLYVINKVISETPSSIGTDAEKAQVMAEARAMRSFAFFMAIQLYGKPYDAATAATDPGFPLVTQADATQTAFTRASVKEVYDFIIADLTAAIPNLPTTIPYGTRMCKPTGQGLLAKVYIAMREYSLALPLLNSCITDIGSVGTSVTLYDYNQTLGTNGIWTPIGPSGINFPLIQNNREALFSRVTINPFTAGSAYDIILSDKARALYQASDLRLLFFENSYPGGPVAGFPGNHIRRNSPAHTTWLTLADMYLLRAECKARANDFAGAIADVVYLRARRMPNGAIPPSVNTNDKDQLIRFIVEERIREFAMMGFRWFDMRRLSLDPLFQNDTYTHVVFPASGNALDGVTTFTLNPTRLTMSMPPLILTQSPDMPDNP
ncbi:RagB/SusD family nutrient uptake outer membrane protein [Pedobacter sp. MC2016-14]|uniref:RagB/SusD family nutrient uptake outer membrane protein n=1 Tax=Pedobacter sp. MC2016-14 TaxID=2897327 RepID=UPI001E3ABC5B|nr:RagB/SusD family nutrient uptake outer membrane protein [Pedobacter sp. MC2016-14]MCD0487780.1 RagB/SusD family nutrient uptake outer membrane protein [Pedobacter sp. MC2016-14]